VRRNQAEAPAQLHIRQLPAALLAGSMLLSLEVLRAGPLEHVATAIGLTFLYSLVTCLLWTGAALFIWQLMRLVPLETPVHIGVLGRAVAIHLAAALGVAAAMTLLLQVLQAHVRDALLAALRPGAERFFAYSWMNLQLHPMRALLVRFPWEFLAYSAILSGTALWHWTVRAQKEERRAVALVAEINRARLHALETQLKPHFLFNTLNTIVSLLRRDPPLARTIAGRLRVLFERLLTEEETHLRPIETEIRFLEDYVAIQRARFGERLRFQAEVDASCGQALVPSLTLQLLVENAIRHGVSQRREGARIRLRVWRENDDLLVEVHDDGPGCRAESRFRPNGTGVGLANTRQRLERLYGSRYRFEFQGVSPPWGGVRVLMMIPYEHAAEPSAKATVPPPQDGCSPFAAPEPMGPRAFPSVTAARSERLWLRAWAIFVAVTILMNFITSSAVFTVYSGPTTATWTDALIAGARGCIALVLLFPVVYCVNHYLIVPRHLLSVRLALHAALALGLAIAKTAIVLVSFTFYAGPWKPASLAVLLLSRIFADFMHYVLMIGICQALTHHRRQRALALTSAKLEAELALSRVQALRGRLHPHSLLDTLASLEALIGPANDEAERLIGRLGDQLRQALAEEHSVSLPPSENTQPRSARANA
jgi:hypothetical protein